MQVQKICNHSDYGYISTKIRESITDRYGLKKGNAIDVVNTQSKPNSRVATDILESQDINDDGDDPTMPKELEPAWTNEKLDIRICP